jgi:hypothetical protein
VRIIPGVYIDAGLWTALGHDERYLLRVVAFAGTQRSPVIFSHYSTAALLGYPVIGIWPKEVHIIVGAASGKRSGPRLPGMRSTSARTTSSRATDS